jgi:hypothetical protein
MSSQAYGHSPLRHILPHFQDLTFSTQKHNIDRELHPKRMDRFTRRNPKPFTAFERCVLKKSGSPAPAVIRDGNSVPEYRAFR